MQTNVLEAPETIQKNSTSLSEIKRKTQFKGTVIKITLAGALLDIGLDTPGVLHISQLSTEPVRRVEDVVQIGQVVDVWVKRVEPKKNRIELTMIKPLALEWRELENGMVVKGKITRLEKFGAFVEIGAERPGLVHISEMTHDYVKNPSEVVKEGDEVEVKVINVNRQKRQIKLSMKALEEPPAKVAKETMQQPVGKTSPEAEAKPEPIPTAMEAAFKEAVERSKESQTDTASAKDKAKSKASKNELEAILKRTLQHKVRTGK